MSASWQMIALASAMLLVSPGVALRHAAVRSTGSAEDGESYGKNPIRKVVTLLQNMAKKVAKEGEEEDELYKKYNCYCKTGAGDLTAAIAAGGTKVPALQSDIEQAKSKSASLKRDLKQHAADRTAAKAAMADATALREKESEAYTKESTELKGYVDAISKAVAAIEKGMSGSAFMQTSSATGAMLRRAITANMQATDDDRQTVLSFLSGTTQGESSYVPKGGEVTGILKGMGDSFASDLAAVEKKEAEALKLYEELIAAKKKEVESLSAAIEKKTARAGDLDLEVVQMKNDLSSTQAALVEDQKFLANLEGDCESKKAEYEERKKTRGEELVALHDTIKILNDDDALELFKKTLPSASSSFVQIKAGAEQTKLVQRTLAALNTKKGLPHRLDVRLLEFALAGRKVDFSKVIKMINDMISLLAQEQAADDEKVEYCRVQIDATEDKAKSLARDASDLEGTIEEKKAAIAQLADELKVLQAGIEELDKSVQEATEQRKRENEEFTEVMSTDTAAKDLLNFAKNRLYKFYNPKLHKPAPKRELSEEDRIAVNMGGTASPTPAPGGIAGTGISAFVQVESVHKDAPPPPPETWGAYQKKGEENQGVISMINLLIRDLEKEMAEAETQENMSQKSYEELMSDSAAKRAKDLKSIKIKEGAKADSEMALTDAEGNLAATRREFMAVEAYGAQLHSECDWLLQNYDLRKTARGEESDNLKNAKAVLSGADFSLLQKK